MNSNIFVILFIIENKLKMKTVLIYIAVFIFLLIINPKKKPIWVKLLLSIIPFLLHYYYCGLKLDAIKALSAGICLGMLIQIWSPSFFESSAGIPTTKTCLYCRSRIPWLASKCKYCGSSQV